jgi:hypothetical protein
MITFWNQKEVFMGYSMQEFNEVLDILAANHIKYKYKLVDQNNFRRGRIGTFGENLDYSKLYYIYVHQRDYDTACGVLGK